jgi:hypothetical protein
VARRLLPTSTTVALSPSARFVAEMLIVPADRFRVPANSGRLRQVRSALTIGNASRALVFHPSQVPARGTWLARPGASC